VTFSRPVTGMNARELVEQLADPHRYPAAYTQLIRLGSDACGPVRDGLGHESPRVRMLCCQVLDRVMDADSIPALVDALADPDEEVRIQALHALACDRCKSGTIRPSAEAVLGTAIGLLRDDGSPHVRARAAELVGAWVHSRSDAVAALEAAASGDASPAVRKKASWYAPGGTIYRRTRPGKASSGRPARADRDRPTRPDEASSGRPARADRG
jgi:HEAT repeat protein